MRVAALMALTFAAVSSIAAPAQAEGPEVRTVGLGAYEGRLTATVGIQDLFAQADVQRLRSGFATRVLVRVSVYRAGQTRPVAQTLRHSEIAYDLWGETFRVRRAEPGAKPVVSEVKTAAEAIMLAAALIRFPVSELSRLRSGTQYRLSFRADLNPLSEELQNEVRRWLTRPPGQGRLSSGDGFFGSVVSFFVNPRVEESERKLLFLSQPFTPTSPQAAR